MSAKNNILTEKQKKFCDVYIATRNAERAKKEAGYEVAGTRRIFEFAEVESYLLKRGISKEHIDAQIRDGKHETKNLTMRELQFCNLYLATGDINKAAIESGYTINSHAHADIAKRKHIIAYLKERRQKMEHITNIDFAWKVKKLVSIINAIIDDQGIDKPYMSTAITAIKTLNDMQGHNATVSYVPASYVEDEDIKKIRELTFKILEEKRNARAIECDK